MSKVETVEFNGRKYRRYPESSNPAHRRYFGRSGARLHRDVWEYHNGPVPSGMHIHHIDGDTGNNDIQNLACVSRADHWKEHAEELSARSRTPEQFEHLERIRPKASEWHRSEAGRAWHREHAQRSLAKTWGKPRPVVQIPYQCTWCGQEAIGNSPKRKYCCVACQSAESRFRLGRSSYEHPHHAACVRFDGGG